MERERRERPEYLPPIEGRRWEFPWLGLLALLLLALAAAGASLHLRTNEAWTTRFTQGDRLPTAEKTSTPPTSLSDDVKAAKREAAIAEMRLRRDAAGAKAAARVESGNRPAADSTRCINGILFRRIPGGWENVPGAPCP